MDTDHLKIKKIVEESFDKIDAENAAWRERWERADIGEQERMLRVRTDDMLARQKEREEQKRIAEEERQWEYDHESRSYKRNLTETERLWVSAGTLLLFLGVGWVLWNAFFSKPEPNWDVFEYQDEIYQETYPQYPWTQ